MLQALKEGDYKKRVRFAQKLMDRGQAFLKTVIFSDESTFHLSGKVTKHSRILGLEPPKECAEYQRDSPKLHVFCAMSNEKIHTFSKEQL